LVVASSKLSDLRTMYLQLHKSPPDTNTLEQILYASQNETKG